MSMPVLLCLVASGACVPIVTLSYGIQAVQKANKTRYDEAAGPALNDNISMARPSALAALEASSKFVLSDENRAYKNEHMVIPFYGFRKTHTS